MDIAIAVMLGVITLLTTYLGVHVTLHPQDDPSTKRRFKIGFWACGVAAILLIVIQGVRNSQAQWALQRQLAGIEQNTRQPPRVEVNIPPTPDKKERVFIDINPYFTSDVQPPFLVNQRFTISVAFKNLNATAPALEFDNMEQITKFNHRLSLLEEDKEFRGFLAKPNVNVPGSATMLNPGKMIYVSFPLDPPLSSKEASDLADAKLVMYVFSLVRYQDDTGKHVAEMCAYYTGTGKAIVNCFTHNGLRS